MFMCVVLYTSRLLVCQLFCDDHLSDKKIDTILFFAHVLQMQQKMMKLLVKTNLKVIRRGLKEVHLTGVEDMTGGAERGTETGS